jgi:type I restriction enzyme S subunit
MGKYKTYEKYKTSSLEWLGNIPEHWSTIRIKFSTYVKGRIGWHGLKSDEFTDEGAYLVTGTDFENNQIDWSRCYHVSLERYAQDPYIQLQNGDLLTTKDGTIGKTAIVSGLQRYATLNSGIFLTRPLRQDYLPEFLCWVLNSNCFYDYVNLSQTGTTINHLYQWTFENFAFQLPPIAEQKSIARFLDRETTRIDTLITKKRQLIALLQKKRFSAIIHAVTKGLDPKVDMKNANVFWLEDVPKHWGLCQLKFACILQRGFDLPSQERKEGEFPIYGGGGITGYHDQAMIQPPGVVTGRYGTVGEVYFVEEPFWPLNTSLYVKEFWGNSPKFIHYLLSTLPIDIYAGKSAVPGVDRNDLHVIPVPIPSKEEQDEIVRHLEKIDLCQSKLTQMLEDQLKEVEKYKSALVTAAVTGKIDVREEVN